MRKAKSGRSRGSTAVDITVWAWGRRIDSCVHFGECLEVSRGRLGFSICPARPPRPIDPVPIEISRFTPRATIGSRPRSKKVLALEAAVKLQAVVKAVVRLTPKLPLSIQVARLSRCGTGRPAVVTGTCCITCNGVTACGCRVEMECGWCCSGECC